MTEKSIKEKIWNLTFKQMKFLLRLWESPGLKGFANGKKDGPVIRTLKDLGFIHKAGRDGEAKVQWKVKDDVLDIDDILFLKSSIVREEERITKTGEKNE